MKGLKKIPSQNTLVKTYNKLHSQVKLDEKTLLNAYPLVRFDPRLGELIVSKILKDWESLNPIELNKKLHKNIWPQVLGVLLEHTRVLIRNNVFKAWADLVMVNIPPATGEIFWIGVYKFAGQTVLNLPAKSILPFTKWGYYGSDLFFNKARSIEFKKSTLSKAKRMKILEKVVFQNSEFTVNDYLEALEAPVHRRLAELDLKESKLVKSRGQTRAKIYFRLSKG